MSTLPETVPVRASLRFDLTQLRYMLGDHCGASMHDIRQMQGGQSNPTFLLYTDKGEYVLRKQPSGDLLPSAHAIDREYRIMEALSHTDVPVPRLIFYCEDRSVIGTPFYVMECLKGRSFASPALPEIERPERRAIYEAMAETLARLHRADWNALGLSDYGKHNDYYARQIGRWTKQWDASRTRDNPSIDRLAEWLPKNIPQSNGTTVVHGDFKLDNIVFHATEPRVIGILDWELSTLGDPMADLAYNCIPYVTGAGGYRGLMGLDLRDLGIPDHDAYIAAYFRKNPLRHSIEPFHYAFALFRRAVIIEGVLSRAKAGNASNSDARSVGARGLGLSRRGWEIASGRANVEPAPLP